MKSLRVGSFFLERGFRGFFCAILVLTFVFFIPSIGLAAESEEEKDSDKNQFQQRLGYGLTVGTFLPYGIFGVRDQYPMWGFRFGHPFRIWRLEWGFLNANAKGVTWYSGSLSVALEAKVDDILLIPFFGVDYHYYSGRTATQTVPFFSTFGGHIGMSPTVMLSDELAARADVKYGFGPGNHLYVGVGFEFCGKSGTKDQTEEPPQ